MHWLPRLHHPRRKLLDRGYSFRAAVRSEVKAKKVLAGPYIKALASISERLTCVAVSDMTSRGAYDDAVNSMTYIIHGLADPQLRQWQKEPSQDQLEEALVKQPLTGALRILESAQAHNKAGGKVRRVVMTSTTVAVVPFQVCIGQGDAESMTRI